MGKAIRVILWFSLLVCVAGCAIQKARDDAARLSGVEDSYGWFYFGSDVQNGLPATDARPQSFVGCGHEGGRLKLFETAAGESRVPTGWWDDRVWRAYARPAGAGPCLAGERRDERQQTCWRSYGLQFYPSSPVETDNRVRVAGASPIIRALPRDGYPEPDKWCRFDGDTALIWVAGVNNRGLGLTWSLTDNDLIANILAWNRNANFPDQVRGGDGPGHGKLTAPPAYIQIVQNDNAPSGGVVGNHSDVAIRTLAANLELAYRAGVKHLEIVTHSNGVVTAQLAYGLFSQSFARSRWNADDWVGSPWQGDATLQGATAKLAAMRRDRAASGAPEPMTLNFYHLQAAASQRWGSAVLDGFGFYSDLLPTARWVEKQVAGLRYWGWEWLSPDFHQASAAYLRPEFRFYYNAPDWMTFDYYRYSSVGRRESRPWQSETQTRMQNGGRPTTVHYVCASAAVGVCGPNHEQGESLWYFSSPAMPATGRPAPWELD